MTVRHPHAQRQQPGAFVPVAPPPLTSNLERPTDHQSKIEIKIDLRVLSLGRCRLSSHDESSQLLPGYTPSWLCLVCVVACASSHASQDVTAGSTVCGEQMSKPTGRSFSSAAPSTNTGCRLGCCLPRAPPRTDGHVGRWTEGRSCCWELYERQKNWCEC